MIVPSGGSRIVALGHHQPPKVVTNDDLCAHMDTTDEWIRQRTGIRERRYTEGDVAGSDMGAIAATEALERAGMQIALAEGEPQPDGGVAVIDVADIRAETDRLRVEQVDVGVVLELHDQVRVVDVFDPDGNRLQLMEHLQP